MTLIKADISYLSMSLIMCLRLLLSLILDVEIYMKSRVIGRKTHSTLSIIKTQ